MGVLSQELLRSQAPVQASLQVLQELGEQLKQQVDTSAASAIQSDHLSLSQRLTAVEQALTRQLTALQVKKMILFLLLIISYQVSIVMFVGAISL